MDPIANMISSINNIIRVKKETLVIPYSKINQEILKMLKYNNYITDYIVNKLQNNKKNIKIILKSLKNPHGNAENNISHLKRISKPGLRIYTNYKKIPRILGGFGDVIISTPKGILTGREARQQKIGGEIICEVY